MGFRIFRHSVQLVFSQFGDAIRISGLIYVVTNILVIAAAITLVFASATVPQQPPGFSWPDALLVLVVALIYLWIAVAWHRFVLLDERPSSVLPPFLGGRILAYLGRLLQVGLIYFVIGFAAAMGAGLVLAAAGNNPLSFMLVPIITITILLLLGYRLAPLFPAAAIGRPIGIGAAWASTKGATWTLLLLALISAFASFVIDLPALLLGTSLLGIPAAIWLVITAWVKLMVGISILTTIYGVYVEKRAVA